MSESIYVQHGYKNRNEYLQSLSEEYCIPYSVVLEIAELYGESEDFDDAGVNWLTDEKGQTFIGDNEWKVSGNPIFASLVDSANYLKYGKVYKIDSVTGKTWIENF